MSKGAMPEKNPFSPSAVAKIDFERDTPVTIATESLVEATAHLDEYLQLRTGETRTPNEDDALPLGRGPAPTGRILAVIGDYGTGKTHLVVYLMRKLAKHSTLQAPLRPVIHSAYLEARSGDFERLYFDFIRLVDREELMITLRDYFADVVADTIAGSGHATETVRRLRNREIDPEDVAAEIGLVDSLLSRQLRQDLIKVTQAPAFGAALTMLLRRKELAEDVWSWLNGAAPTQALSDRGISAAIRGAEMSLEAMGTFAHLYGRRQHRFVLAIDELDNVLTAAGTHDQDVLFGLKKLFEVFQAAGGFLLFVGLPDILDIVGENTRERISYVIHMADFGESDVRSLIKATHQTSLGQSDLAPFAESAPRLIASIAHGSVRQVIRLCHRAYREAMRVGLDAITDDAIRAAARVRDDLPAPAYVKRQLAQIVSARGLPFQRDYRPAAINLTSPIDLWIAPGDRRVGCAIIVTASLVGLGDSEPYVERFEELRANFDQVEALLVVVGYLHIEVRERLAGALRTDPLEYARSDFDQQFGAALSATIARLEDVRSDDPTARILERLAWIGQQNSIVLHQAERATSRLDELRLSFDRNYADLRGRFASTPESQTRALGGRMPDSVEQIFSNALRELREFAGLELSFTQALDFRDRSGAVRRQADVRARLSVNELYSSVGAAAILRDLVQAFRAAVLSLFDEWGRELREPDQQAVSDVCQGYEAIYFDLQVTKLDDFPILDESYGESDSWYGAWILRRQRLRESFDELGVRVQQTILHTTERRALGP